MREMKLEGNLYWDNGKWIIEFAGDQLKVEERGGLLNIYRVTFPPDLIPQLEEWLDQWRPLLNVNRLSNVFVTRNGGVFTKTALNAEFRDTVYDYTGRATNIHMARKIWATEYILKTRDPVFAAQMLGDTVQTVLRNYAHLFNDIVGDLADEFLKEALVGKPRCLPQG